MAEDQERQEGDQEGQEEDREQEEPPLVAQVRQSKETRHTGYLPTSDQRNTNVIQRWLMETRIAVLDQVDGRSAAGSLGPVMGLCTGSVAQNQRLPPAVLPLLLLLFLLSSKFSELLLSGARIHKRKENFTHGKAPKDLSWGPLTLSAIPCSRAFRHHKYSRGHFGGSLLCSSFV